MEDNRAWCIYILRDPRYNDEIRSVRYVGQTVNLKNRTYKHLNCNRQNNPHKKNWIELLKKLGIAPFVDVIDWGFDGGCDECECRWIAHYRSIGCKLLNMTDGGEGCVGRVPWNKGKKTSKETLEKLSKIRKGRPGYMKGRKHSKETRRKISIAQIGKHKKGHPNSEETRRKLSETHQGKKHTEEEKKKISESMMGKVWSEESKKKLSESKKGHFVSEETRKKISEIQKGNRLSDKTRKKMSESHKGKKRTETTRQKIRDSWKLRKSKKICQAN